MIPAALVLAVSATASPANQAPPSVGIVLTVEGNAYAARSGMRHPIPLAAEQPVFADDAIETQPKSRLQILLDRDTLITLAESSRLILGRPPSDEAQPPHVIGTVDRGHIRLLIGDSAASLHEPIHLRLPESEVTVDHGYLTAWVTEGIPSPPDTKMILDPARTRSVGVANIGSAGDIIFTSGKEEVTVPPGYYSTAIFQKSPSVPSAIGRHNLVRHAMATTDMKQHEAGGPDGQAESAAARLVGRHDGG